MLSILNILDIFPTLLSIFCYPYFAYRFIKFIYSFKFTFSFLNLIKCLIIILITIYLAWIELYLILTSNFNINSRSTNIFNIGIPLVILNLSIFYSSFLFIQELINDLFVNCKLHLFLNKFFNIDLYNYCSSIFTISLFSILGYLGVHLLFINIQDLIQYINQITDFDLNLIFFNHFEHIMKDINPNILSPQNFFLMRVFVLYILMFIDFLTIKPMLFLSFIKFVIFNNDNNIPQTHHTNFLSYYPIKVFYDFLINLNNYMINSSKFIRYFAIPKEDIKLKDNLEIYFIHFNIFIVVFCSLLKLLFISKHIIESILINILLIFMKQSSLIFFNTIMLFILKNILIYLLLLFAAYAFIFYIHRKFFYQKK